MGRQTQKNVNGTKTRYIHSGIRIIAEYDGSDTFKKRYVYGTNLDEVLLEIDNVDDVTYLHHDRIGSIVATTNDIGTVVDTFAYSPWGECNDMTGTTFGFQGQRYDHETGLYFMKARYYDPKIGRFVQPDPIGYEDGLNLYQFAYNNPTGFTDPLGLGADGSSGSSDAYSLGLGVTGARWGGDLFDWSTWFTGNILTLHIEEYSEAYITKTPMGFDFEKGTGTYIGPEIPEKRVFTYSYDLEINLGDAWNASWLNDIVRGIVFQFHVIMGLIGVSAANISVTPKVKCENTGSACCSGIETPGEEAARKNREAAGIHCNVQVQDRSQPFQGNAEPGFRNLF